MEQSIIYYYDMWSIIKRPTSPTAVLMRDAIEHHYNLMRIDDLYEYDDRLSTDMYYGIILLGEWLQCVDDEDNYVYSVDDYGNITYN